MAELKKLSPMMQKKLAAKQAEAAATTEATSNTPAEAPTPAPAASTPAPTTPKLAPQAESTFSAPKMPTGNLIKNPNGERYGYGDGLASTFGTPPAIDDAYEVIRIISKLPATILDGAIGFFKKVTS